VAKRTQEKSSIGRWAGFPGMAPTRVVGVLPTGCTSRSCCTTTTPSVGQSGWPSAEEPPELGGDTGVVLVLVMVASNGYDAFPHLSFGSVRASSQSAAPPPRVQLGCACYWNQPLWPVANRQRHGFWSPSPLGSQLRMAGDGDGFVAWGTPLSGNVSIGVAADRLSLWRA